MKGYLLCTLIVLPVIGFSGLTLADTDTIGDNIGPIDLQEVSAELYERDDGVTLLKVSVNAVPNLPGVVTFTADVDNSTGTGGSISQLGAPVAPCPCKTTAGQDISITMAIRPGQGKWCGSCDRASGTISCERKRESGEWYANTAVAQPFVNIGIIRGLMDPLPKTPESGETADGYTFPWDQILAYAHMELNGNPEQFNWAKAQDPANIKWEVSIWYDAAYDPVGDDSDISTPGPPTTFDINDWYPNDNGVMADMAVSLGATDLTYCEGNFDGDKDVDGGDAAKFKANFGRSPFKNPCPACGPNY
jgi:hypothetical protein